MMQHLLLLILFASTAARVAAQDPAPCASPEARQFDFWIGDWDIDQEIRRPDGTWLRLDATTSVAPALDGCALVEHWKGEVQFYWEGMQAPEPMKGLSVRVYDEASDQWYIHWMDSRAPHFAEPYVGGFRDGRGEFFRRWESPQGLRVSRITFSDVQSGSVEWDLSVSDDGGSTWTALWKMTMRRPR